MTIGCLTAAKIVRTTHNIATLEQAHMTIQVKKSTPPETKEILAEAIIRISESFAKLSASGLNREAIIVLLHDHTKISKRDIKLILDSLTRLRGWYCR